VAVVAVVALMAAKDLARAVPAAAAADIATYG
jgi:hypothetical protein